ncbi:MAG: hypothetical protein HY650_02855 [Acidobacteria bacterium]|nr:hypothetical protein [Acidobacteriota bacterium]
MNTRRMVYLVVLSLFPCFGTFQEAPGLTQGRKLAQGSEAHGSRLNASAPLRRSRLVRLDITRRESFADGMSFGSVGPYEKLVGTAYLQADPDDPQDSIIQDIELAPRNAAGMVEYQGDFYILKPVDMSKGNGTLFYEQSGGGAKTALRDLNRATTSLDPTTAAHAGDGFLMNRGYTIAWCGWNGRLLPGANRMTLTVPVATEAGATITGRIGWEIIVNARTNTSLIGGGANQSRYETVSLDTSMASLTMRMRESDQRIPVPSDQWAFADCSSVPFPGTPRTTSICLRDGFDPNFIYQLVYTTKDPKVEGLGLAAVRDVFSFLRYGTSDDRGTPNPLAGAIRHAIAFGQGGGGETMLKASLHLGFNQDASGRRVFDGVLIYPGSGRHAINVRFAQGGNPFQHESHDNPGHESPLTFSTEYDPVAGYTAGRLDRCQQTGTCPKIMQTLSSVAYWQNHFSLITTDAFGRRDLEIPANVRIFLIGSSSSGPNSPDLGMCQQLGNPSSPYDTVRALLSPLQRWITEGVEPPPSRYPTLREGTLVRPDKASIGWPDIPGVKYTGLTNELSVLDYGPLFNNRDLSGIITEHPPKVVEGPSYVQLVPRVDADGNEVAGIRSTTIQAPLGTYTGWNLRRAGFAEDELCGLRGSFIPFARTRADRLANGDPRLSIQERYGTHDGYVSAVRAAAERLTAQGFLLPEDAQRLIEQAGASDVLR